MILVDSSGWLEFFADGPLAAEYGRYLATSSNVVTPTVVLHEVYKVIKRERGEEDALIAAAQMSQTRLVALDDSIALTAADLGLEHKLAMADSIVYATAQSLGAELVTSDADFSGLSGVTYLSKAK
ncbi:MAG: type II toxin-antitoxin system VapC family toxin [Deltaproteobacteria bacterium]|nr:type II toxin-antitoxin system VapC family toxin [Deltaproteobacteria bacterium]